MVSNKSESTSERVADVLGIALNTSEKVDSLQKSVAELKGFLEGKIPHLATKDDINSSVDSHRLSCKQERKISGDRIPKPDLSVLAPNNGTKSAVKYASSVAILSGLVLILSDLLKAALKLLEKVFS